MNDCFEFMYPTEGIARPRVGESVVCGMTLYGSTTSHDGFSVKHLKSARPGGGRALPGGTACLYSGLVALVMNGNYEFEVGVDSRIAQIR